MIPYSYDTASQAVNGLVKRGYTANFSLLTEKECLVCHSPALELSPDEFEIDEIYRFEGMTDPGDESIVYGISSKKHGVKGVIVNAYGMYADGAKSQIVQKLNQHTN